MDNIKVNIAALEEKIGKLTTLKTDCESIDTSAENLVGSGMSIEVLHAIDKEYDTIKAAVVQLLGHSIAFFENVKSSMIEADEEASDKINKEAGVS